MKLDLKEIIHTPGSSKPFQFSLDLSETDLEDLFSLQKPIQVQGCVTNHAGALALTGECRADLNLICDRCCVPFSKEKLVPLDFLLASTLEEDEDSDEEYILFQGTELDLDQVATLEFLLALDTKNLCSEDCKGLCPGCGANLNVDTCQCQSEIDPRLAALGQLLDDKG